MDTEKIKILCITCPKGCTLEVTHEGETVVEVKPGCKRGHEYANRELVDPAPHGGHVRQGQRRASIRCCRFIPLRPSPNRASGNCWLSCAQMEIRAGEDGQLW